VKLGTKGTRKKRLESIYGQYCFNGHEAEDIEWEDQNHEGYKNF